MASVVPRKTANGLRYQAKVRIKGIPPAIKTFTSQSAAEAWAAKKEAEYEALQAAGSVPLERFLERASVLGMSVERAMAAAISDFLRAYPGANTEGS